MLQLQLKTEERAALINEWRDFLDAIDGDLTAEQEEKSQKYEADIDKTDKVIARLQKQADVESRQRELESIPAPTPKVTPNEKSSASEKAEARKAAFEKYLRTGNDMELRATTDPQTVGTDADGGYTVPDEWYQMLVQVRDEANVIRQLATTIQTSNGTVNIPTVTHGVAQWEGEGDAIPVAKETFGNVTLSAFKAARLIKISRELLNDSMFNMPQYIIGELGRSIGKLEESGFIAGDNSSKPNGIFTAATTGVTAASATAVTADEIMNLYHSVGTAYRRTASSAWIMKDATLLLVRKLKDGNQNYLWQPGLAANQPDTLLGAPVYTSEYAPAATTGLDSILFGDISGYYIGDRVGLEIQRLDELYAANGYVGFIGSTRTDGELADTSAVRVLTMG